MKKRLPEMDEFLERIWTQRERGSSKKESVIAATPVSHAERWLSALEKERLIHVEGERLELTSAGEQEAEKIIRRHRLTERLFSDLFETSEEVWEKDACELEHESVLSEEAISAICAFLGHPPTCPHGRPIPRGRCCSESAQELTPFVVPLHQASNNGFYRVVFITPKGHAPLDRLASLGLLPGRIVRIIQKKPVVVVRVDETEVALDDEIVRNIFVRKALS
ncbi:MAG: FeoA domain-containing protein [Deltaproteobacteria bacterium]|nr:FeoA domain-containing protein [Deltaproteobacteria bacterium]MBI2501151.1 FeoA domain-containing protein [Deltaproteobacteria bacterium]MBI4196408.1 FeoA domain-containing protein [Deltaproteobacteria bacterium]